jgi:hypothetical protein
MSALELLGVRVWAAGRVALDRALAPGIEAASGAALAFGALAVALLSLWIKRAGPRLPWRSAPPAPGARMPFDLGRAPRSLA